MLDPFQTYLCMQSVLHLTSECNMCVCVGHIEYISKYAEISMKIGMRNQQFTHILEKYTDIKCSG